MTEETIFTAALAKTPAERAAYLEEACAGDVELRQRVEGLLHSHEEAGSFLETPVASSGNPGQPAIGETTAEAGADRGAAADFSFLQPSDQPGHLGRLGHYEILEKVGAGGFGLVFKARDESLERIVAIKVLNPQFAGNSAARRRFIREAKAAAAIRNEHVIAVYAVDDSGPVPYLAMEFIGGVSLQDKLDKSGPLEVKEILRIGQQAACGLAAAHAHGLIHRDIKPANILLENGVERVKITDFGLARAVDDASVTQSGTIAGTPMYMAPEQAAGETVDHRADLFSLGSVLYALCTGHPPFRASGTMAVLKRVCEESPRSIKESNPDIPDWLCDIVARLHAKKPAERFQSAKEVAALLEQHLAHLQQPGKVPMPSAISSMPAPPAKAPEHTSLALPLWLIGVPLLVVTLIVASLILFQVINVGLIPLLLLPSGVTLLAGLNMLGRRLAARRQAVGPRAVLPGRRRWPVAVAAAAVLAALLFSVGPAALRYVSNRADLELVPQDGLTSLIVLQNDATVTDWLDMQTSHTLSLSPGKYRINPACKPGYEYEGMRWELTTAGLFGDQTVRQSGTSCELEVQRGERVTVRAMPRRSPPSKNSEQPKGDLANSARTPQELYRELLKSVPLIVVPNQVICAGTVIDKTNRLVLTSAHVLGKYEEVTIFFPAYRDGKLISDPDYYVKKASNDRAMRAKRVFMDEKHDLALLQLERLPNFAEPLPLVGGQRSVTDRVVHVGHPASAGLWVYTEGRVRQFVQKKKWQAGTPPHDVEADVVLTDAPTGPGYSGAPVVNDRGALVGVVAAQVREGNLMSVCIDISEVFGMLGAYVKQGGTKLALAAGSEVGAGKSVAQPPDEQQLQGVWKLVGGQDTGWNWPAQFIPAQMNMRLTFAGDKADLKWLPPAQTLASKPEPKVKSNWEGIFHLDTSADPKRMSVFIPNDNDNSMIGIYKLEGNRLTYCYRHNPKKLECPTEFATKKGDGTTMLMFERMPAGNKE
jgi:uncharacterized protein (TIGR03067 family)